MEIIPVETTRGIINEVVYNIKDFPYDELKKFPKVKNRSKKNPKVYYNVPATFDIETTLIDGVKDKKGNYIKGMEPYSFMYHWQFCIGTYVVFGRRFEELKDFFKRLREVLELYDTLRLIIYVHNLAYEFQFIKDFLGIDRIFARKPHKPMKYEVDNFEFRCSYFLSNMSLSKFSENSPSCYHRKLSGDNYDYTKLRTPDTPLTLYEKGYCYNDVRGLAECIQDKINDENNKSIADIPLTSTGYVRRDIKECVLPHARHGEKLRIYKKNREVIGNLTLTLTEYKMLKQCFRGGNTHANRFITGHILSCVYSYDIKSSYPAVMMYDYFPMKKFRRVEVDENNLDYYLSRYCCLFEIWYKDLNAKIEYPIPYISVSKCQELSINNDKLGTELLNDNGRVLKASYAKMSITEIDYNIIKKTYDFTAISIENFYVAERGRLPKEFRIGIMKFFYDKTVLAQYPKKIYEKNKSKNKLNSSYGMCVTDIINPDINYVNNEWVKDLMSEVMEESAIEKYNKSVRFLYYAWGVWITAHARNRLQYMLNIVKEHVVYVDTDSIKFLDSSGELRHAFEKRNEEIIKINDDLDVKGIVDMVLDINGKPKKIHEVIGTWEYEKYYISFKTLGAKKYCYHHVDKPDVFQITVSGMDKKKGAEKVKDFSGFTPGRTYSDVGRTVSYYNEAPIHEIEIEGSRFLTASNVAIVDTTYTFNLTDEYQKVLGLSGNNYMMEVS